MVSVPENALYAEWWYIVGLFSTKAKAMQFIRTHHISRHERYNGKMQPRTRYNKIVALEIDKAPLLEEHEESEGSTLAGWEWSDYFGMDRYLSRKEKTSYRKYKERHGKAAYRKRIRKQIKNYLVSHKGKKWVSDVARELDLPLREVFPVMDQLNREKKIRYL